jgi:uncharacterized protein YnzC (UPF0291/DUF896 family)
MSLLCIDTAAKEQIIIIIIIDPMGVDVWRKFEETDRNDKVSRCDFRCE